MNVVRSSATKDRAPGLLSKLRWSVASCLVTLLALPVNAAIVLPTDPLTTASRVPPNILFILDDSGSMAWRYMYNPDVSSITGGGITSTPTGNGVSSDNSYDTDDTGLGGVYDQSYATNTVYYNPAIPYTPWLDSTGTPLTGGTSYSSVYSSTSYVTNTAAATVSPVADLGSVVRTFYVPKNTSNTTVAYLSQGTNYYRFQILTNGRIVRSERLEAAFSSQTFTGTIATNASASLGNYSTQYSITVPSGASNLAITTRGGTCTLGLTCADLYVRYNGQPTVGSNTCASATLGNNESCLIAAPTAGNPYNIRLRAGGLSFSGVSISYSYDVSSSNTGENSVGCDTSASGWGWRNCTYALPASGGRNSEDDEKTNFATWFSYYRTRTKAAKAGASAAFSGLGTDVRVGFRTIQSRNGASTNTNMPTNNVPIPVRYNNGLFDNPNGVNGSFNNRAQWYNRLYSALASSGTPLRGALKSAGDYYSSKADTGAYGPESGTSQYACRQSFSILTTDGYWNDDSPGVGNVDGVTGDAITGPNASSYKYSPTRPYSDSASNTLADVAMNYWNSDLRLDLDNTVPTTTADPAFWQHMVTFGISIGLKGTLDPSKDLPAITAGTKSWPSPSEDTIQTIDDLWHAAVNGRGSFLAASNPADFTDGLKNALSAVTQRVGSFSNVTANSTQLDTNTRLFQATYQSGLWTGELYSYAVTSGATAADYSWKASSGIPTANRKIFTYDGTNGAAFPTATQVSALQRTTAPAVSGADNAAYIAGDTSKEIRFAGGTLRNRNTVLGDIVSSSPAYSSDSNTVFIGANDGMLHAFGANDGNEKFAYVPGGVDLGTLSTLSNPTYSHRFFVDGPIVVSTKAQTPAVNILVGSLGKGGKGLFALDVTNPTTFSAASVKWEKTGASSANIGLIQGRPVIAKLNNGLTALIVANGINSTNERAVLLIYNLDTGALIREIDTNAGSATSSNGLAAPIGWDADGNGTVDYVYGGDMLGNVWKFDLSSSTATTWAVANAGNAMFKATAVDGTTQPITAGMSVAMDPQTYKTWLFFGTGRLMTNGDLTSKAVQAMYGIIDAGAVVPKSDLTSRSLVVADTSSGFAVRAFQKHATLPLNSKGWYINLLTPPGGLAEGERVVSEAQVVNNALAFSSVIPTADACQADGRGYVNVLDAFTGTSLASSYFDLDGDGSFTDEVVTDANGNQLPIGSIDLGVGMPSLASLLRGTLVISGSSGKTGSVKTADPRKVGRVSWREIIRD